MTTGPALAGRRTTSLCAWAVLLVLLAVAVVVPRGGSSGGEVGSKLLGPWRRSAEPARSGVEPVGAPAAAPQGEPDELDVAAVDDARRFLAAYVDPDGRVVRRDQGGDTVSEGQAYALLIAAGIGDRPTFDRVLAWTDAHLRRPDGLLAWRWADGQVQASEAAADADLDLAWALALAGRRWPDGGYGARAAEMSAAVVELETAPFAHGRVLAAGPWAVAHRPPDGAVVLNPSYASPVADSVLGADGYADPAVVEQLATGHRRVLDDLVAGRGVPTDWARVHPDGRVAAADGPTADGPGTFGWDAARVPLRFAASCEPADVALAAAVWPAIEQGGAGVDRMGEHPARLVAAAAAAGAAGDDERAVELLDRASSSESAWPTYYGGALTALGRLLLTTDRLGGCPPV